MSLQTQHTTERRIAPVQPQQPVGGAVIDAQGREIPITEGMVQQACEKMEEAALGEPEHD